MAFTPRPKLNELIEKNKDQKYECLFSSTGKKLENTSFPSWMYTVIHNNTEYVYFANAEYHALDIDRNINTGNPLMNIWVSVIEDEEGLHKAYKTEALPFTQQEQKPSVRGVQSLTQGDGKPNWDEISRGKCRHAYALSLFTEIIKKDGTAHITQAHTQMIEGWVEYSMSGTIPTKNGKTLDSEPF